MADVDGFASDLAHMRRVVHDDFGVTDNVEVEP